MNHATTWRRVGALALLAALYLAGASAGQAREKVYLGVGAASTSASGDLDGNLVLTDPVTGVTVIPGRLDDGSGVTGLFGAMVDDNIGLELGLTLTSHDATHNALPGEVLAADLFGLTGSVRLQAEAASDWEVFARLGLGVYVLSYERNTVVSGSALRLDSDLTGLGLAAGLGTAILFGQLGLELALARQEVTFDEVDTGGELAESPDLDMTFDTATITLFYHWSP